MKMETDHRENRETTRQSGTRKSKVATDRETRCAEGLDYEADAEVEVSGYERKSRQVVSILRGLNVFTDDTLSSTICQLLPGWTWTDDDVLDCVMRAFLYRPAGPLKYWGIREIDENTVHVELLDNSDGCVHAIRSQDDPAVEFHELEQNLRVHLRTEEPMTCTAMSSTCLKIQRTVSRIQRKPYYQTAADYSTDTFVAEILAQVRTTCDGFDRKVEIILKQMNREKQEQAEQSIHTWLQGSRRVIHDTNDVNRAFTDQEKRIKALEASNQDQKIPMEVIDIDKINRTLMNMEKRMKVLEATNADLVTKIFKLQFEKVLVEMKRKGFRRVLDQIAQAQREATAARLGFGKVLREMKKKGFAHLLYQITASRRDAKAVELADRLQQLQLEAQEAGVCLGNIHLPLVMPKVVHLTGAVSKFSNSIQLPAPESKQL
ncbi:hypothetical protein P3T76_008255 [Phytophthora citrophthora]|uniref:Uncharacterized protein n=1 Tax=Phytophthora citrophthora TaxID=4793 RepID=A0AAD9GK24_9STRA|nr:hypothetical protein P3T76_008255 [Phytophthora citrophthora]